MEMEGMDMSQIPGNEVGGEPGLIDAGDENLITELSDGISDYIHGKAREHIAQSIANAGEEALGDTIAALSYQILSMVSKKVAQASPEMVTMELLLPLATETIDFLIEISKAIGIKMDEMQIREDALFRMIEIHMAKVGDDPEQKAIAEEMFAEFMEDGTFDESADYIQQRMKERGGDPDDIKAYGQQMAAPQQNQLSAGIQQGLAGPQQQGLTGPGGGM